MPRGINSATGEAGIHIKSKKAARNNLFFISGQYVKAALAAAQTFVRGFGVARGRRGHE